MDAKNFILKNSKEFSVAAYNGLDIRMDEAEILDWMERYAQYRVEYQDMHNAMNSMFEVENEIKEYNEELLKTINHNPEDFQELMDDGLTRITDKIEWVKEPEFEALQDTDVFGVFTLTHVDQWTTGMECDSYGGFMYVKVDGFDKWLKIPYEC